MDNFDSILTQFGGAVANDLNCVLKLNEDSEEEALTFPRSPYIDIHSQSNFEILQKSTFNLLSINIQSINAKFNNLLPFLETLQDKGICFDAIQIQETWLSVNDDRDDDLFKRIFNIPGYDLYILGRKVCAHGGLFTYVKDEYKCSVRPVCQNSTFESLFIDVNSESFQNKITLGNIYRPAKHNNSIKEINDFMNEILPIIDVLSKENSQLAISGDFNINLLEINNRESYQDYLDLFITRALYPQITLPTRFSKRSATLIDQIFCKTQDENRVGKSAVIVGKLSDHFAIYTCIPAFKSKTHPPKYITTQDNSEEAIGKFVQSVKYSIENTDFCSDLSVDPNSNYDTLQKIITECKNECMPLKRKRFNKYKHKLSPWMTPAILISIKHKDFLYKKKITASPDTVEYVSAKINLNTFSSILQKLIRSAKLKYYHDKLNKFRLDSRKTWSTINDILWRHRRKQEFPSYFISEGNKISDKQEIADGFNTFFTSIGPNLSKNINSPPNLSFKNYLNKDISCVFNFKMIESKDVSDVITELSPKSSCGVDEISTKLLKKLSPVISPILAININQSLTTGSFPDKLKIAKVLPLYKKGSYNAFDNYRPISLLPSISKVFEKIVFKQLYDYFLTKKLIYNSQYGFRALHSTELAALEMTDRVSQDLDKGELPLAIYLDLSKAFDTLDHEILLSKLRYYGINGTALSWFSSYLQNRSQYVYFDGINSSSRSISTGVPQGSILGPLLFLIYMNDIAEATDKFHSVLYADDTTLTEPLSSFNLVIDNNQYDKQQMETNINVELDNVYKWLCVNKLSLNIPKTKFMIFHHRQKNIDHMIPNLFINKHPIEKVADFNFLGITLDEHLNWNKHIQKIANKISRNIGCLNRLKNFLPLHTLKLLYSTLILPHLQYGILLWGFRSDRIFKLQKRAVRVISLNKYNAHTEPIFKELELLKIEDIFNSCLLKFQYKLKNDTLPSYFSLMFDHTETSHTYHTRNRNSFIIPIPRTSLSFYTIRHFLPRFMDTMPRLLTEKIATHSLKGFSIYAKNYFIGKYSSECHVLNCYVCKKQ